MLLISARLAVAGFLQIDLSSPLQREKQLVPVVPVTIVAPVLELAVKNGHKNRLNL
jgi:hypothetical protein